MLMTFWMVSDFDNGSLPFSTYVNREEQYFRKSKYLLSYVVVFFYEKQTIKIIKTMNIN